MQCPSCDVEVELLGLNAPRECLCGMHEIMLLGKQPGKPEVHPAVARYRVASGCRPTKEQVKLIEGAIPPDDESVEFWGKVIHAYKGCGWTPKSVDKMIAWFERGQLPKKGGANDGRKREPDLATIGEVHSAV